jgi:DNA polymerase I-like protein with 3'-5' exonuclease and polymerase domains
MQRGVKVDLDEKIKVIRELRSQNTRLELLLFRILREAFDLESINYKSPDQLRAFFYGEVKEVEEGKKVTPARFSILRCAEHSLLLDPIKVFDKQKKEYRSSTNREALEKLSARPIAKHICEIILLLRDADKKMQVLETGLENGRMHCSYQVAGTLTGRWSSNASAFGSGTNLQNISDEMRRIFVPDEAFA